MQLAVVIIYKACIHVIAGIKRNKCVTWKYKAVGGCILRAGFSKCYLVFLLFLLVRAQRQGVC